MRFVLQTLITTLHTIVLFGTIPDPIVEARKLVAENKHNEARHALLQLHENDPSNIDVLYALAQAAIARNDSDEAIQWAERCALNDSQSARYQLTLGDAYGMKALRATLMDKIDAAKHCRVAYEKAVELEPNNYRARRSLADFYWQAPGLVGGGKSKAYL